MHYNTLMSLVVIAAVVAAGFVCGMAATETEMGFRVLRYIGIGGLVLFTGLIVVAVFGVHLEPANRIVLFWALLASIALCGAVFSAGLAGCCRKAHRRAGAMLLALVGLLLPIIGIAIGAKELLTN